MTSKHPPGSLAWLREYDEKQAATERRRKAESPSVESPSVESPSVESPSVESPSVESAPVESAPPPAPTTVTKAKVFVTVVSPETLERLPEYSASVPTGPRIGFRWKKNQHAGRYVEKPIADGMVREPAPPKWVLGAATHIGIRWSRLAVLKDGKVLS